jgi:hypothetical protein
MGAALFSSQRQCAEQIPMDGLSDQAAHERMTRIRSELEPRMRRVCSHMPEEEFQGLIDKMARVRLADLEKGR